MRNYLVGLVVLLAACGPARAEYYTPGEPISSGPAVFSFPGGGWGSHYCQVGDTRQGQETSCIDQDDVYSDEGYYLGMVWDSLSTPVWSLDGPGTLSEERLYTAPLHGGGTAVITRTVNDSGLWGDDPPRTETMRIMLGPARIEVRALASSDWLPEGWQPSNPLDHPFGNTVTVKARSLDADPEEGTEDINAPHVLLPPGLAMPVEEWTRTRVAITLGGSFSNYPGVCSNYDSTSAPQSNNPDYWWPNGNTDEDKDGLFEALLQSRDWGGTAEVTASASWETPEGNYPLTVFIPSPYAAKIPRDTDGDGLPDGYELLSTTLDLTEADTDNDGTNDGADDDDPLPDGAPSLYGP